MSSTSLAVALSHAVAYLTRNLPLAYPMDTVTSLRMALMTSLKTHYSASWDERNPTSGSGRRCLTLAPGSTPPRSIYTAAKASGVNWQQWITLLGNVEIDLFVDPGVVRIRTKACPELLIWSAAAEAAIKAQQTTAGEEEMKSEARAALRAAMHSGTRSRMLRSLAVETSNLIPPTTTFTRGHSRSSSLSSAVSETSVVSEVSSLFSAVSAASAATSIASAFSPVSVTKPAMFVTPPTPAPAAAMKKASSPFKTTNEPAGPYKMSRREKARQRRTGIVIAPPAEVTPYDNGKTTVLGGGIRLGSAMAQPRAIVCA
jgi:hypothetical protein